MRYTKRMRIGIDISQVVYEKTGVGTYVRKMVQALVQLQPEHTYVLFGSSLRQRNKLEAFTREMKKHGKKIKSVIFPLPPTLLHILWNVLHIIPIDRLIGPIDVFWSSDWTQPPVKKCIGMTTIHDVSFLRYPESFAGQIRDVQKRRLYWAKRECDLFLCDSEATKQDVIKFLHIPEGKLKVVYPGYNA